MSIAEKAKKAKEAAILLGAVKTEIKNSALAKIAEA
jgi:gamma-glutamyl phosphate reductase